MVFGVNVFDLDSRVQVDSIEQPIKSNSVGSGNMSHCRASSLYDHLDHCFVVFKHIQQSFLMRGVVVWGNKINIVQTIDHSHEISFVFELCEVLNEPHVGSYTGLPVLGYSDACFREELRRSDPINQVRVYRPSLILHPRKWFLILLNCAKLKFVSYTYNWLEKMYDFHKCTMFLQKWILNPQEKSESWNSPSLHCFALYPTWQYCLYSLAQWM